MELAAPAMATLVISMLLVIAAVIVRVTNIGGPMLPTRGFLLLLIGYLVLLAGNLCADQVTQEEPGEQVRTDTPSEPHMGEPPSPNQPQPVYPEGKPEGL